MSATVRRLQAEAHLATDPEREVAAVRRRAEQGDESWRQWYEEYQRGEALILSLIVSVTLREGDREEQIEMQNDAVWVEDHVHPPKVEQQVAELARKDFAAFADELAKRGVDAGREDLEQMFVGVKLGDDVVDRLGGWHRHIGEGIDSEPGLTA